MTRTRRIRVALARIRVALAVIGFVAAATLGQPALAQRQPVGPIADAAGDAVAGDAIVLPTDREAKGVLVAAKEYVVKKDWDVVARSLQYLLEKPEDSFFAVTKKHPDGKEYTTRISIRIEANRMIGELPPEGLEVYRQKFGAKAKQMLEDGTARNDPQQLSLVAMRYRHTEAGAKAIHWLADHFLDRGNYQSAVGQFQQLLDLLETEKPEVRKEVGPKLFFKAALVYQRLGNAKDADTAKRLFKLVEDAAADKGLTFGSLTFTVEQLRAEFDRNARLGAATVNNQSLFRGDSSRTAQGIGGEPFLNARMTVSMVFPERPKVRENDKSPLIEYYNSTSAASFVTAATSISERLGQTQRNLNSNHKDRPILPGFFPLAARNRVLFRTYDGLYAYWIRDNPALGQKAGEIDWMQHAYGSLNYLSRADTKGLLESWCQLYQNPNLYYGGTAGPQNSGNGLLFENAQVGSLSHDNQLVYFVDDLAVPPPPFMLMNGGFPGQGTPISNQDLQDRIYCNTLWAVELESGLLKWQIGARKLGSKPPDLAMPGMPGMGMRPGLPPGAPVPPKPPAAPKPFVPPTLPVAKPGFLNAYDELMDTYFLGPPLPLNGLLYVLAENAGEIQLICINPTNTQKSKTNPQEDGPELVWRQPLGTANNKLVIDVLRRITPAHLSYSDGKMICPTNAGAIVAVDVYTRSLTWAHSYRAAPKVDEAADPRFGGGRIRRGGFDMGAMQVNFNQDRWHVSAPAIVNGRVVFTAHDANAVQCLSLKDGELLWSVNRDPKDLYFAGVFNGKVLIVGKDSIKALDLLDGGKVVWDKKIGLPSGQGVASNNIYYLPLRHGLKPDDPPEVCAIDVDTGEMHHTRSRKREEPGNLIFHDGDVISQSIWRISAFPQLQAKLAEMNQRLQQNPADPVGLLERGELHLDKGQLAPAVEDLKAALEHQPPKDVRDSARAKLYDALTELLQIDFVKAEPHLPLYKDLCLNEANAAERLKRQSNYLCILGKGREAQGKLTDAFDAYMEYGQLNGGRELVPSIDDPGTLSRPDVWARGRIAAMLDKAKPADRKPLEDRIADQWKVVQGADDVEKIRGFVKLFGASFVAGKQARLQLAERLLASRSEADQREAQLHLYELAAQRGERELAAKATDALAQLMIRKKMLDDAVYFYRKLGTDFADVPVRDGKTGAEIYQELITEKRFLPYLEPERQGWNGIMRGEPVRGQVAGIQQFGFSFEPEGELLPFFARHRLVIDASQSSGGQQWQMRLLDRVTGVEIGREPNIAPNPLFFNYNASPQAQAASRVAQARGHLLLLTSGTMVYCFDLADKGEHKKLWEYNLLGKNSAGMQAISTTVEADGTVRQIFPDGHKQRIGALGIFESSYVCLTTRDGLAALDPLKGTLLWKKESSPAVQLFGDDSYIFVVEMNDNGYPLAVKAVRAADGVKVEAPDCRDLLHPTKKLRTIGRNILVFDDDSRGGKQLRLYDALTGKDVWSESFAAGALPVRSTEAVAGVIEPNGTLTLFDLHSHKVVLKTTGGPNAGDLPSQLAGIQEVHLLADRDHYYLVLNKPPTAGTLVQPGVGNGLKALRTHGFVYAYDRLTGEVDWILTPTNQYLILEQFQDLPILIFASQTHELQPNGIQNLACPILGYDKRTGLTICETSVNPNAFYGLTVDAKAQMIELIRHDVRIRFAPKDSELLKGDKPAGNSTTTGQALVPLPPAPAINIRGMPGARIQIIQQAVPVAPPLPPPLPLPPAEVKPVEKKSEKKSDKP